MNTKNIKFWHRQIGKGMMTIAADTSNFAIQGDVSYGIAFCSPEDQFCRKTGRAIALTRLKSCWSQRAKEERVYFGALSNLTNIEFRNIPEKIYWTIINNPSKECFPQWAKPKTLQLLDSKAIN